MMFPRGIAAAAAIGLAIMPCLSGCGRTTAPNVLFITVDTLRADRLGCAGYPIETPTIDRLAEEGIYFSSLYASVPTTLPSHASLFTSKRPFSNGVRTNGLHALDDSHTTLAEVLSAEGYETGAVTASFVLHSMYGLAQGFMSYEEVESLPHHEHLAQRPAGEITRLAEQWLKERKSPWFLWVHYFDPHTPYEPPEPYRTRYEHPYDGEIAYTDSEIGKLLTTLRRRGMLDSTLVVFISDHGEALGEHGEETHGLLLYEPTVRVPFILWGEGIEAMERPIHEAAAHMNVAPTVLDLLGIPLPVGFQGQSLRLRWEQGASGPESIYTETCVPYYDYRWAPMEALVQGGWKYILAPRPELYHVVEDPKEERDLVEEERERAEGLRRALLEERKRYPKAEPEKAELTEEALEKLQSLGYLAGGRMTWEEPDALAMAEEFPDIKERMEVLQIIEQSRKALSEGRIQLCADLLERAFSLDPTNLNVLARLAAYYQDSHRPREALDLRRRLADIEPLHAPEYYRRLAEWESVNGNSDAARQAWEKAVDSYTVLEARIGTLYAENYYDRALCYEKLGQAEKAEADLRAGLARYPDSPLLYYALGAFSQNAGNWDEAQAMYETALRYSPHYMDAKVNLSTVLLKKKDFQGAAAILEEIHGTTEPTVQTLNNLAHAYSSLGRYAEAEPLYLKSLALEPTQALARAGLADLAFRRGDAERGTKLCREVLASDPKNREARMVLEHHTGKAGNSS
ncbi:MAG: sulfatase-like hydrolase/transferase [Acidobacteriota bacterium]|nr:MAG: sulfatase-like hydrolase/transferase [Acidobacteriota bacterium]